ncbi:glycosyltransferase [Flavobacterium urumqiense]|uniref:Glycosyltransferase involved in cell wall bisynthesis n=1 Tax=Flavobacterium urumqiense TaxID=935224 RepID=A0A1H6ASQ6_9FLAO|nr:glycosyltransferase [Flavobacterium urumqiense]SEG51708.1 Glycosyltransferase involved in cell wall bisynthesis [Flavobacterium urumqiense]
MTFVIITHVPHILLQNQYFAYGPYVKEMNIWTRYADRVIIVAPKTDAERTLIDSAYEHDTIEFVPIENFDILTVKSTLSTIFKMPKISWSIFKAMQAANHIHLRCPGNAGLFGSIIQIAFPTKKKTAKYAGNWDPKSKQPWTYKLQQHILSNTFLTRKMQVLVYGQWKGSSKNIKPFFTATYQEIDKLPISKKVILKRINFIFVGALVKGKNPMYAIQLIAAFAKKGNNVRLSLYGEGVERSLLESYILKNNLEKIISLEGNQSQENVKKAYQNSHFVILPSDSEGWPKAIAEGMFWGCVPLAKAVSCVPFMLDKGERGVLLEMHIDKDCDQIASILHNQIDFDTKRNAAAEWSRSYTLDVFEEAIKELIV